MPTPKAKWSDPFGKNKLTIDLSKIDQGSSQSSKPKNKNTNGGDNNKAIHKIDLDSIKLIREAQSKQKSNYMVAMQDHHVARPHPKGEDDYDTVPHHQDEDPPSFLKSSHGLQNSNINIANFAKQAKCSNKFISEAAVLNDDTKKKKQKMEQIFNRRETGDKKSV